MAKFDLKSAIKNTEDTRATEPMNAGYPRVIITQIAEVGLQRAFNVGDEPKNSVGIVFDSLLSLDFLIVSFTISSSSKKGGIFFS